MVPRGCCFQVFFMALGVLVVIAIVNYYFIIAMVVVAALFFHASKLIMTLSRDLKILEGASKYPFSSSVVKTRQRTEKQRFVCGKHIILGHLNHLDHCQECSYHCPKTHFSSLFENNTKLFKFTKKPLCGKKHYCLSLTYPQNHIVTKK